MTVVQLSSLSPPIDLVNQSETVVIVSMKRPLCVYFDRVMDLVSKGVVSSIVEVPNNRYPLEIRLGGCGGSISRCKQIARYSVRAIREKFKHQVKSVEKRVDISGVDVLDFFVSESGEEDVVDMSPRRDRKVASVCISLIVEFSI